MKRSLFIFALLFAATNHGVAKVKAPAWLAELAARSTTMSYGDASHAVLCAEALITIDKDGTITRRTRRAIRVLTPDGPAAAVAKVYYIKGDIRVSSFQAWTLRPQGEPLAYGSKHTVDFAVFGNAGELYNENRYLSISGQGDCSPGAVFGYESIVVEKSVFSQEAWRFQDEVPVEYSSLSIDVPEGWSVRAHPFNSAEIVPIITGRTHTWTLRQLPALKTESLAPSANAVAPRLGVDIVPPSGARLATPRMIFSTWPELAAHFSNLYKTRAEADDAVRARGTTLASTEKDPWSRLVRLARCAQDVNYIAIALDLNRGGGMIPRHASRVFATNYGDCKDKTTLLSALLRSQGIESFPVLVYSGDRLAVRPEWVSPLQFNHAILAIRVDESIEAPAVIAHPELGRLLFFDPTNRATPLGWLPFEDLGGYALILGGGTSELVKLPVIQSGQNRLERRVRAHLTPDGTIRGSIAEEITGLWSTIARTEYRNVSATDFREKTIQGWLNRTLPGARADRVEFKDDFNAAHSTLNVNFEAGAYGKMMRDQLMIFKPALVPRRDGIVFKEARGKRTQPIVFYASSFIENTEIEMPDGFALDELPSATDLKTDFGRYLARLEVRDRTLFLERSLELKDTNIPASGYDAARTFFEKIIQAEQAPVVLRRL